MRHGRLDRATAEGLKVLRQRIEAAKIPPSKLDETFNFATWNIRDFGKSKRLKPSIHYLAEILNQFDLIALTEVRDNLGDLSRVLEVLEPYWDYVLSDFGTDRAGNKERVVYLYDKRMVRFTGLAAEADEPRVKKGAEYLPRFTWWRAPYMASFRAGNFDFVVLTVHIRWGKGEAERLAPLEALADWVNKRRRQKFAFDKDIIVVGDMNIPSLTSPAFQAVTRHGLRLPKALADIDNRSAATNLSRDARYDQILQHPTHPGRFTDRAGALDFHAGDIAPLYPGRRELLKDRKFTWELSDHLPLWVQIDSWIEDEQLDSQLERLARRRR